METTSLETRRAERWAEDERREDELATLASHLNAATARWLELAWEFRERVDSDDFAGWLGYRAGSQDARRASTCGSPRPCASCP
jgi:hypothetical protein